MPCSNSASMGTMRASTCSRSRARPSSGLAVSTCAILVGTATTEEEMPTPYPCSGPFIPTNFARKDEAMVEHQGDIVALGFYGQDGKTSVRHGMTVEAARAIAMEMLSHCDRIEGVTTMVEVTR